MSPADRRSLLDHAAEAASIAELFRVASAHLRRLIPYDTAAWFATDPATGLPTTPTRAENTTHHDADACMSYWERELLTEDLNLFRDLARAPVPAASLRASTGGWPARSIRYREFLRPRGYGDELRTVLRTDGSTWGYVALHRADGEPAFDGREVQLLANLSQPLAEAIRTHAQVPAQPPIPGERHEPGLMLFTTEGVLISCNDAARGWLEEVRAEVAAGAPGLAATGELGSPDASGVHLLTVVYGTLMQARAIAQERERGIARARIRSDVTGQWLVCHASCLRDARGELGDIALVIEPAKAAEIAPIVVQAYELSPREQQITQLVAQGAPTAEIAGRLCLSAHTVRDYVKAIFDKVGVSSRSELVARLFAEHYAPIHLGPGNVDGARVRVTDEAPDDSSLSP